MAKTGQSVEIVYPVDGSPNFLHCSYGHYVFNGPWVTTLGNKLNICWDKVLAKQVILTAVLGEISQHPLSSSLLHGQSIRFGDILDYNNVLTKILVRLSMQDINTNDLCTALIRRPLPLIGLAMAVSHSGPNNSSSS